MPFCLFWLIGQTTKPKTRRGLLNENYSSQRARCWWAITSPLVPAAPARASPESTVARACAMASSYFFGLAAAERGARASSQPCAAVYRAGCRTKGGWQGPRHWSGSFLPAQSTVGPGVVWRQQLPSFTVHSSSLTSSRSAAPVRPPLIPARGTASPGAEGT